MTDNFIYVEDEEDRKFLNAYIEFLASSNLDFDLVPIKGKDKLIGRKNDIEDNLLNGSNVSIIFDADSSYESTRNEIEKTLNDLNVNIFLFPDNENSGILEDLLEQIINPDHKRIFDCFESYKQCVGEYKLPDIKAKIYAYKEALGILASPFADYRHWNFEHAVLEPLKNFLSQNLLPESNHEFFPQQPPTRP